MSQFLWTFAYTLLRTTKGPTMKPTRTPDPAPNANANATPPQPPAHRPSTGAALHALAHELVLIVLAVIVLGRLGAALHDATVLLSLGTYWHVDMGMLLHSLVHGAVALGVRALQLVLRLVLAAVQAGQ